ncbi:endogenous retrovirus group K member 7 Env polyprotein-like isoform 1-T2 [Molossus nigricans]
MGPIEEIDPRSGEDTSTHPTTFHSCQSSPGYDGGCDLPVAQIRPDLWIPVTLTRPWSDSIGLTALYSMVPQLLKRSKRFVGLIIATILGLASVATTAAVAGVALRQGIQTADVAAEWYTDAHTLWEQQRNLDSQLHMDIENLQHTVK